jgi:hypothetical protein
VVKKQKVGPHIMAMVGIAILSSLNQVISNALPIHCQRWYLFEPHMDVHIGDFVGVQAPKAAQQDGKVFWIAKVREL